MPYKKHWYQMSDSMKVCVGSSDYLQAVISSLEDELMVVDENYRIIKVNDAVLVRHGKRQQEVIGQHCYEISHDRHEPCHPPSHECPVKAV
jgi:PAS domain S-box-containing protein